MILVDFFDFLKIFKIFRRRPNAPERIRVHPNASEQVQTGPSKSKNFKKLAKTLKTSRNFAQGLFFCFLGTVSGVGDVVIAEQDGKCAIL